MKEEARQQIARMGGIEIEPARAMRGGVAAPHGAVAWPHVGVAVVKPAL